LYSTIPPKVTALSASYRTNLLTFLENPQSIAKEDPSTPMQHWTLAVMHAAPKDAPDVVRAASVMGFLYVSDVDEERRKIKLLAPVSGRLGDQPLVWGKWPEPFINLLG